jgi:PAS domain S-box-containing protein
MSPDQTMNLLQALADPSLLVSDTGRVLAVNGGAARLMNASAAALYDQSLLGLAMDEPAKIAAYLRMCGGTRHPIPGVLTLRTSEPEPTRFRFTGTLVQAREATSPAVILLQFRAETVGRFIQLNRKIEALNAEILKRLRVENELRKNQLFTQSIIDTAPTVLYTFDLKTKIPTYLTAQAATALGYSLDEVKDRLVDFLHSHMHPDDATRAQNHFQHISQISSGEALEFEFRMRHKDGRWRWFRSRDRVFKRDENGEAEAVLGVALDITERKQMEEALSESEKRYRGIVNQAITGVAEIDLTGQFISVNERFCAITGYSREEHLAGMRMQDITHPDDLPENLKKFEKLLHHGIPFEIQKRYLRKDGTEVWVDNSVYAIKNAEGKAQSIAAVVLDITESKQVQDALRASEARFRRVLAQSNAGIVQADAGGQITLVNQSWCEMLGYSEDQLLSMGVLDVTHESSVDDTLDAVGKLAAGGPDFELEKNYCRRDGSIMPALSKVSALRGNDGEYQGLVAVVIDMTERLKAEAESRKLAMLESQAGFQEAERHRIARDLHDHLGQQLTALRLALTDLKTSCGNDLQVAQKVEKLQEQALGFDRDLSQLAFELRPPHLKLEGLAVTLTNYVTDWSKTFQIHAECIIDFDSAQRLADEVEINLFRITQEALNNTHKHASAKTVSVLLKSKDNTVKLIIEDDGIGFDTKTKSKNRREKGGGLGLIGMQERIELLDGTLEIESQPGRGTTIYVTAPATYRAELP